MRRVLTIFIALATTLALTGCLKVDMALEVHEDSMVSGEMTMGISKAAKQMMEGFAESFGDEADASGGLDDEFFEADDVPEGATVEPYEDDKFIGQTMKFDKVSLEEINQSTTEEDSDEWTLRREGDTFVFEADGDFGGEEASEAQDTDMDLGFEELFAEAELRIAVTFPGDVIESNGEIDGRTVVWTPEFGDQLTMHAVAQAEDDSILPGFLSNSSSSESGFGVTGVVLAVMGGLLVLLVIALGLLLITRRKKSANV